MILNMNDNKNASNQAEMMIGLHERLFQGSKSSGLTSSDCAGIVISSNYKEHSR